MFLFFLLITEDNCVSFRHVSVYLQTTKDTVMRHVSLFHFDQILVHTILFTF